MYYIFQKIGDNYHQTMLRKIKTLIINCLSKITNKKLIFMDKLLYCLLITSKRIQTNKPWTDLNFHCLKKLIHKILAKSTHAFKLVKILCWSTFIFLMENTYISLFLACF